MSPVHITVLYMRAAVGKGGGEVLGRAGMVEGHACHWHANASSLSSDSHTCHNIIFIYNLATGVGGILYTCLYNYIYCT